jgi:hypothetical protein
MLKWNEATEKWDSIEPPKNIVAMAKRKLEPDRRILERGEVIQGGDKLFDYNFLRKKGEWRETHAFGYKVGEHGYQYTYSRRIS